MATTVTLEEAGFWEGSPQYAEVHIDPAHFGNPRQLHAQLIPEFNEPYWAFATSVDGDSRIVVTTP